MRVYITENQLDRISNSIYKFLKINFGNNEYISDFLVEPVSLFNDKSDPIFEITILFNYEEILDLSNFKKNVLRINTTNEVRRIINNFFPNISVDVYSRVKIIK